MRISSRLLIAFTIVVAAAAPLPSEQAFSGGLMQLRNMPPTLPPEEYGNTVLNRLAEKNGQQKVVFPHWSHRSKFTCRVCHLELEFGMRLGETPITEKLIREGRYCGHCHNGKTAFAPKGPEGENCKRCHSGGTKVNKEKFNAFAMKLPAAPFGNKIDWMRAMDKNLDNQFCGVCHLRIAFPLNDCKRCHPGMRSPS